MLARWPASQFRGTTEAAVRQKDREQNDAEFAETSSDLRTLLLVSSAGRRAIRVPENVANGVIRFGIFEADLRAGELRRNGSKIKLQDQPFQLLALLVERPGEVVTREELRGKLWPDKIGR